MVNIVDVRDVVVPIRSDIGNAFIDFSSMTVSVLAAVTDVSLLRSLKCEAHRTAAGLRGARHDPRVQRLVLVSGPTGTGKSVLANAIASDLLCAVGSFDWLMSALRSFSEVWQVVELPVERQRLVGWSLLSRLAEQELRHGRSVVLDLVAREHPRQEWVDLADRHDAQFRVIECTCSNVEMQRTRVERRSRDIPGWYELTWSQVERSRSNYVALDEPKLVVDAVNSLEQNLAVIREYLGLAVAP